ncbi:MAG TPA: protein kinase [Thermoanaerobaculia bacterium]|nr:protein kinase [Thermoanaerobaculia bacterium]
MAARDAFSADESALTPPITCGADIVGGPLVLDGKYWLDERLGEGTTGVVYRALHLHLKKSFAVKVLRSGSSDRFLLARFEREAEALGRLRHPHVVEITDFGIDAATGMAYLVMELLEGKTLAAFCREEGPLPLARALPLLDAIAAAVDAAHAQGVLHRDLKPGNVLLVPSDDGEPRVKVLDFGLAEILGRHSEAGEGPAAETGESLDSEADVDSGEGRLTLTGALLGTPHYVAPELIRQRNAGRASDLYSFGVIAYELLAGKPPFLGSTAEVLAGHLHREAPAPAPWGVPLPEEVWQALEEPLRKAPALRPASARGVVAKIRRAEERSSLRRWKATELPRRALLSVGLTGCVLLAGLLLPWPLFPQFDDWIQDLRAGSAPTRAPDPRILLLTLDEASLAGAPSLANRADEIGAMLERVFAAGAKGIAIDLLLPAKWAESTAFSDLVLRHPDTLALAAFSRPDGWVVGPECLTGLTTAALGPDRVSALFGFVNLDEDEDGVTRKGRLRYLDHAGQTRPSWSAKAAAMLGNRRGAKNEGAKTFRLDPRIDWPRYPRLSWRDVPAVLGRDPGRFRNRLVLLGGEFEASGDEVHRVPPSANRTAFISGLALQAMLTDTLATGLPVREPARVPFLLAAIPLLGLVLGGVLCVPRARPALILLVAAAVLYLVASFPAFWWAGWQLPVSLPLLLSLFGLLLVLIVRRRLPPAPEVSP